MATGLTGQSFELSTSSSIFKLRVNWSETYNAETNTSVVTIDSVEFMSSGWYGFTYYPDGVIRVNGVDVLTMNAGSGTHNCRANSLNTWSTLKKSGGALATGSTTVVHDADGSKKIKIEVAGNYYDWFVFFTKGGAEDQTGGAPWTCLGSREVSLTTIPTYTLTVKAATGSTISVNRTYSGYADTGAITHGTRLYYNDMLKITFTASTNYMVVTHTVNGATFTSGNTHKVSSDVAVVATAQVLASTVGATDANIGATSTITVTKYNTSYYHTLEYEFGSLSGYITSSGDVSSSASRFSNTSIAFTLPTSFYAQIPNSTTGTCTITCRTYSSRTSSTQLGNATTCQFTATAANSKPTVVGTVTDTDAVTVALTGDSSKLIRYRSNAQCSIVATPKNSSSIKAVKICGSTVTGTTQNGIVSASKSYNNTSRTSFAFVATDSRGYETSVTTTPTVINYIELSCDPIMYRPAPTGSEIKLSISGNFFRGSFGAYSNTLTLQYCYKEAGGSYGSWHTIDSTLITIGTSSYRSKSDISVGTEFDYHKDYFFKIRAIDGAGGYNLTSLTKEVQVNRGIPVFDWGSDDFNVNVNLMLKNINILDIMYPVGSVYMHSSNTIPGVLADIGTWESITTGISGIYALKRTA